MNFSKFLHTVFVQGLLYLILYAYKALNGLAPEYVCNMVELYAPDRVLRSASQNLLVVPRGKHCQYGMRTFAMAAATL